MQLSRLAWLLVVILLRSGGGQTLVVAQDPADPDEVIRVETDVTNLPFTAIDKQKRFITTLQEGDIRVLEDGVPQQLFTFQRETDRPLALALLIDCLLYTSPSPRD